MQRKQRTGKLPTHRSDTAACVPRTLHGTAVAEHLHHIVAHVGGPERDRAVGVSQVHHGVVWVLPHHSARAYPHMRGFNGVGFLSTSLFHSACA